MNYEINDVFPFLGCAMSNQRGKAILSELILPTNWHFPYKSVWEIEKMDTYVAALQEEVNLTCVSRNQHQWVSTAPIFRKGIGDSFIEVPISTICF